MCVVPGDLNYLPWAIEQLQDGSMGEALEREITREDGLATKLSPASRDQAHPPGPYPLGTSPSAHTGVPCDRSALAG